MIDENTVYDIYDKFAIEDNEVIIEEFNKIIEDVNTSNTIKSKACCGIGDLIIFLDPDYCDDAGYRYYKKALEYDENNLDILFDKFDEISDEDKKKNIIQLMKNLVKSRLKNI